MYLTLLGRSYLGGVASAGVGAWTGLGLDNARSRSDGHVSSACTCVRLGGAADLRLGLVDCDMMSRTNMNAFRSTTYQQSK